jgi:hypothetical protein
MERPPVSQLSDKIDCNDPIPPHGTKACQRPQNAAYERLTLLRRQRHIEQSEAHANLSLRYSTSYYSDRKSLSRESSTAFGTQSFHPTATTESSVRGFP